MFKAAIAIVFSVVLVLAQAFAGEAAMVKQQSRCAACVCQSPCCVSQSAPTSTPQPVRQASAPTAKQYQLVIVLAAHLLALPAPAPSDDFSTAPSSFSRQAVPLYEWNCAYLI